MNKCAITIGVAVIAIGLIITAIGVVTHVPSPTIGSGDFEVTVSSPVPEQPTALLVPAGLATTLVGVIGVMLKLE